MPVKTTHPKEFTTRRIFASLFVEDSSSAILVVRAVVLDLPVEFTKMTIVEPREVRTGDEKSINRVDAVLKIGLRQVEPPEQMARSALTWGFSPAVGKTSRDACRPGALPVREVLGYVREFSLGDRFQVKGRIHRDESRLDRRDASRFPYTTCRPSHEHAVDFDNVTVIDLADVVDDTGLPSAARAVTPGDVDRSEVDTPGGDSVRKCGRLV